MSKPRKKQRLPITAQLRFRVLERDNFKCAYCGMPGTHCILEVDHVKPIAHGGTNDMSNLAASCADCNAGKSSKVVSLDDLPEALASRQIEADLVYRKSIARMVAARLFSLPMPHEDLWIGALMGHAMLLDFYDMVPMVDEVLADPALTNQQRFVALNDKLADFICPDDDGDELEEVIEDAA